MVNFKPVVDEAQNALKTRALGGVTKESALEAIQKVADGAKKITDDAVGAAQRELQAYKGKSAQEMATLTSQKDAVILAKEGQIAKVTAELDDAKAAVKSAKATKTGKPKQLLNGNTETVKVNKNGARMTTEKTPEGKTVKYTVETINGDIRTTTIDPVTGRPVKTFTNINGDTAIQYTQSGVKVNKVNTKKSKVKPTLISTAPGVDEKGKRCVIKSFSDGSKEIKYPINEYGGVITQKHNSKGTVTETLTEWPKEKAGRKETFDPETKERTFAEWHDNGFSRKSKSIYSEVEGNWQTLYKETTGPMYKTTVKREVDDFGMLKPHYVQETMFSKDSPALSAKTYRYNEGINKSDTAEEAIVFMKDGSRVKFYQFHGQDPQYMKTISKDGVEGEIAGGGKPQAFIEANKLGMFYRSL